ncbi:Pls/PosA family non-ribosomal peptide synthetase [Pseudonocardia bannensis]|uniref:Amino acid adenylation domain-containing protein n=1 Tax=Pseudonocardia bannensis TaxID=630973 RepID=A0A848DER9_9PSEU|nr:Pls/PosA family non-ribosomal peptide synthetase [Pseudonocardia bannensis]NMH91120.1 amino acid adenylation domain-containing protein [Pseudonocardia bannensis]
MSTTVDPRDVGDLPVGGPDTPLPSDLLLVCPDDPGDVRWRPGERLDRLFEDRCDQLWADGRSDALAVDAGTGALTYDELDARANQLARHLLARGIRGGHRVALLFDDPVQSYIAMLAVLKVNAAYVPLDPGFPTDRLAYIVADAGAVVVLTLSHLRGHLREVRALLVCVDDMAGRIGREDHRRLADAERGEPVDDLAYLIYTSGTTGRPKGVAIGHPSICNFVRVAAEVYGVRAQDRMYQGMTIAFDFSVEEIWVSWMAAATLVPKPAGSSLLGVDLHRFLVEQRVTAMCCVPTLLATIEDDLPDLRFLLVSGEACPQDLIARWHRPGRRFLNVYGPTEATVSATWTVVHPDRPVTIGVPLPTYATVILDPDDPYRALPHGEIGEIGIAGVGLATGYLNREDLTAKAFIPDFLGIAGNPSGRIYRTGDLGRVTPAGEIEYHGRIDTQVKIRGYRIELTEIESVLLQVPGIAAAVVDTYEPEPGIVELVGYYSLRSGHPPLDRDAVYARLRAGLPAYMVPAYLEHLQAIPMTTSDKADRKRLPPPTARRSAVASTTYAEPGTGAEAGLADALAAALGLEQVSVTDHFFDDLGASSLLLARFCARVRKRADLPAVSMRDVYLNPTVRSLAAALGTVGPPPEAPPVAVSGGSMRAPVRGVRWAMCGALQLMLFLASTYLAAVVLERGFLWVSAATGWVDAYLRSVGFGAATFVAYCCLPIAAKWLLIGRWKPTEIPIWSLRYVRFWVVKTLIRANPMAMFAGSPLYLVYLRALGARIGRDVVILSRTVPVCTDLLTIGDGTVIRREVFFSGYRAQGGMIQTGPVTLGRDVVVSEHTVLDIGATMSDRSQLGHASSLHEGQVVPAGERWHGSPAQPTTVDYRAVGRLRVSGLRRFLFSAVQLLSVVLLGPVALAVVYTLLEDIPWLRTLLGPGHEAPATGAFYLEVLVYTAVLFFGGVLLALLFIVTVPRVLFRFLQPDTVYRLYGFRHYIQRVITRMTNSAMFTGLFGDSSYIVTYLRGVGYDLSHVEQTGSNFGMQVRHDIPYLSAVGRGTMVSDGLTFLNADYSNTSFRVRRTSLGSHSFLGNDIAYPSRGRTGDNCLLGTKVMIPIDGPVRRDVGLLGSPAFEIPRTVQRDTRFDHLKTGEEFRRRLAAKNRYNIATILLALFLGWLNVYGVSLIGLIAMDYYDRFGEVVIAVGILAMTLFAITFAVLQERGVAGFRALRPRFCSIYEPYFWWHERFWKLSASGALALFNGTPFKPVLWRLLGVRMGRRVFDDGTGMPEKSLVTIGDDCNLNAGSVVQCHSMEDGTFKSDRIVIGPRSTLGVKAFVHYGTTLGSGAVIDADSFLMKGEEVAPGACWRGNPATEIRHGTLVENRASLPRSVRAEPAQGVAMSGDAAERGGRYVPLGT